MTEFGDHVLSYGDLRVTDADSKRIPARLALGPDRLEVQIQARGAKWPIVVDPLIAEPGEPILDWIETDYVLGDTEAVEIVEPKNGSSHLTLSGVGRRCADTRTG